MSSKAKNQNHTISLAVLRVLDAQGWQKMTLTQVAKTAKVPLARLEKQFPNKIDFLPLIVEFVTEKSFAACGKLDEGISVRDGIFDVLMARFDVLQLHRKAILSIADSAQKDAEIILTLSKAQYKAMQKTLKFVSVRGKPSCIDAHAVGLMGVYWFAFRVWITDEAIDMPKTMAALNRYLQMADKVITLLRTKSAQF